MLVSIRIIGLAVVFGACCVPWATQSVAQEMKPVQSTSDREVLELFNLAVNGGNNPDTSAIMIPLGEPSMLQQEYLGRIAAGGVDYGASLQDSDGNGLGTDVIRAMRGETQAEVAQFSIKLRPDISGQQANDIFSRNGLLVLDASESFGVVSVGRIISEQPISETSGEIDAAVQSALDDLRSNPEFISVAPELGLSGMEYKGVELVLGGLPAKLTDDFPIKHIEPDDELHWGLSNIKADLYWESDAALRGAAVGVLDVGFALHKDLPLWDLPNVPADDHGNHVSGIICGNHDGVGIKGVLRTCLIVGRVPRYQRLVNSGDAKPDSMVAVLNALESIMQSRPELKAINVSLGYNWTSEEAANITQDQRKNIASMAVQLEDVFEMAKDRDIFIVSAAGNDSGELDVKMDANWSSPINFAARAYCAQLGWCNGVVVEAHHQDDASASFSNGGGTLSCPGVNIVSAMAYDSKKLPSNGSYGLMSGTSMAAPFCTGGLVLLGELLPNLSAKQIIDCARSNGRATGTFSAPALDIEAAFNNCQS